MAQTGNHRSDRSCRHCAHYPGELRRLDELDPVHGRFLPLSREEKQPDTHNPGRRHSGIFPVLTGMTETGEDD